MFSRIALMLLDIHFGGAATGTHENRFPNRCLATSAETASLRQPIQPPQQRTHESNFVPHTVLVNADNGQDQFLAAM